MATYDCWLFKVAKAGSSSSGPNAGDEGQWKGRVTVIKEHISKVDTRVEGLSEELKQSRTELAETRQELEAMRAELMGALSQLLNKD